MLQSSCCVAQEREVGKLAFSHTLNKARNFSVFQVMNESVATVLALRWGDEGNEGIVGYLHAVFGSSAPIGLPIRWVLRVNCLFRA